MKTIHVTANVSNVSNFQYNLFFFHDHTSDETCILLKRISVLI